MTICRVYSPLTAAALFLAVILSPASAQAQVKFRVVSAMGQYIGPVGLAEGAPGVFYTIGGGGPEWAISVTAGGTITQLGAFPLGYLPTVLVGAADQRAYGGVAGPGGSVLNAFSVSLKANSLISYGQQTIYPTMTQSLPDGTLLGVGYQPSTGGTAYLIKSDLQGNLTVIYQFPAGEQLPNNAILGADSNYYGVSWQRYIGNGTAGYIYKVTPSGTLTKLYSFGTGTFNNYSNFIPIVQGSDGNLYGATTGGGANGYGSVYQLTPAGQYTTLYSFTKGISAYPQSLIQASDGNLYAASEGVNFGNAGQISRISTSGQYTPIHGMSGTSGSCQCIIIQGSVGDIYGTALNAGNGGGGTVFAINAGLPKPAPQALSFSPASAAVGKQVRIWGYNMLKATVSFNGVTANTVHNSGPNYVFATVPAGATTGPITVTTPGGTSTTQASFIVQ